MSTVNLTFVPLAPDREDAVAVLTLSRPAVSNAFNGEMIDEMLAHFETITRRGVRCRAVVVRGEGKHFSGGADLEWMRQSAGLSLEANRAEAGKLSRLFATLYRLPAPTIAVVHGASFGGAVGLIACCDWAIADANARFCLSEVKVGLVAAVILPYLAVRIHGGDLKRFVLTARIFGADEARQAGLVQRVAASGEMEAVLKEELGQVVNGEPHIQRTFKLNHRRILEGEEPLWKGYEETGVETIAKARVSPTGQAGIRAFLDKKAPEWAVTLPPEWKLY